MYPTFDNVNYLLKCMQLKSSKKKNTVLESTTYLGPRSSVEHSLRFRDSALAGSDEFSPTPLILNAYQRLEYKHTEARQFKRCLQTDGSTLNSNTLL